MAPSFSVGALRLPPIDPAWTRLVAAVLSIAVLAWAAVNATRRGAARRAEITRVQAALVGFADLRRRYEPAVAAESIAWRRTWMELQNLGVGEEERLGVTRSVARAAESAGLQDVRVLVGPSDTTGLETRLSTGGIGRTPAPFGLVVEGRGGMQSVIAFLGQLPPSAAATQLSLVRQDGGSRHRISLAVFQLTYPNGAPTPPNALRSSLERGATGDRGAGRPDG